MMWFEELTGFAEEKPEQVRKNLAVSGTTLRSKINGKEYICGRLEIPTLADLRKQVSLLETPQHRLQISEVVGNVQALHGESENEGALFQAASQFNLLEMVNPRVTPEQGIGIYQYDRTQGPACAIACGAGTIYRNYFAEINGRVGQTADNQIDCLKDIGRFFNNEERQLWQMQNGYALANGEGLKVISREIQAMSTTAYDELKSRLRIGLQWNTEVTLGTHRQLVSQVYCSALPVAYSQIEAQHWESFARLVLEATYEATFLAALINYANTGNPKLFLTLVGGGAFGNPAAWIFDAIRQSVEIFARTPLQVKMVSYGRSNVAVRAFVKECSQ